MIMQETMTVLSQRTLASNIYEMTVEGELVQKIKSPGQFVHIRPTGGSDPLLRRPISISSYNKEKKTMTLIYRAEGKGTTLLSEKGQGENLDVIGPLGNGFNEKEPATGSTALLVGGGVGVPPLYELAKQLEKRGVRTVHVLGFQSESNVFYEEEFKAIGRTLIATVDGTHGIKGFVTDVIKGAGIHPDYLYACGPTPMLKAIQARYSNIPAYLSLEQRMGCGIGACFACVCRTQNDPSGTEYVKVCTDGPVFPIGKVVLG